MSENKVAIICIKWGTLYHYDYVNVLYNACNYFLPIKHRFICLTDDTTGLLKGIETYPIPNIKLNNHQWIKGGWPKIGIFQSGLIEKETQCLFLDLDTIILDDLSEMVRKQNGLTMIKEWKRFADYIAPWRPQKHLSGVFGFQSGEMDYLFDRFSNNPELYLSKYRIEQYYLEQETHQLNAWDDNWIISFKRSLMPPSLKIREGQSIKKPLGAKLMAFHGNPRPHHVIQSETSTWGKRFRQGTGIIPWINDYWNQFS